MRPAAGARPRMDGINRISRIMMNTRPSANMPPNMTTR